MKPQVICHMMAPLDGRLKVDDWAEGTGHTLDELVEVYDAVHDAIGADAWLSGRSTGEEFADAVDKPYEEEGVAEKPVHVADKQARSFAVLIDTDGRLRWEKPDIDGAHIIVILGAGVPESHLVGLAKRGVSYIVSSGNRIDLASAMDILGLHFGISRLMLEGGASTNGQFLEARLVDEISLVLFPAIGGKSKTPSIFEAGEDGLADKVRLRMKSHEPAGLGSLHIMYDVLR